VLDKSGFLATAKRYWPTKRDEDFNTVSGFNEGGMVFIDESKTTDIGTLIHESIHLVAPNSFVELLGNDMNEGVTEYFTRQLVTKMRLNIARTSRDFIKSGAAGLHIEDQVQAKRCGHRPGKALVSAQEMSDRIKAAVDGRTDPEFVIMARTDAHAVEGQAAAVDRALAYVAAGADMIFAEALATLAEYREFTRAVRVPVLANITEFGKTPLLTVAELADAGVSLVLYPLSAFRAMSKAALAVYGEIRSHGTQRAVIDMMQTRTELYEVLGYHEYERKLDELFSK